MQDRIIISSSCLYKSLLRTSNVIVNKPLCPVLEDFFLEINGDVLKITASDSSTTMYSFIGLDSKYENIKMSIPSGILLQVLKNLPEQPIELINDRDKNNLTIKTSNGKYNIACDDPSIYPNLSINKGDERIVINGKKLTDAIETTIIAASNDPLKPVLNNVLFEIKDFNLNLVATDVHKLIRYNFSLGDYYNKIKFIVPKRVLLLLKNMLIEEDVNVFVSDKHIYLESGNDIFISALINDEYPDYERVIPTGYKNNLFVNRLEFLGSLKRLHSFTNGVNFKIELSVSSNKLTLIARDDNSENDAIEVIDCNYGCQSLKISYNIKYLIEILQNIKTDTVLIIFSDVNENGISNKATMIKPFQNDDGKIDYNLLALLMPICM